MSPLFVALLASFGLAAVLIVLWVAALDRAERARIRRAGSIPTITSVPRAIAIPTAVRRRWRSRP